MARGPNFRGTFGLSPQPVAGVTLYRDRSFTESTMEELLEKTEKDEVLSARKDNIVAKLKKQGEPNPKRYTVDPETGKIDVDEEGGEYTQKDALMVSASIKGKGGQYDAAIALITAAKALVSDNQPNVAEKPKEFLVDPETGIIIHDPENGEYTLSEARTISQSLQKGKQEPPPPKEPKGLLERLDEMTDGLISKRITSSIFGGDNPPAQPKDPVDEFLARADQVDKVKLRFGGNGGGTGVQALAQTGSVRGEILRMMLEDERERLRMQQENENAKERNKLLGGLVGTIKDNAEDFIGASRDIGRLIVEDRKKLGVPPKAPQSPTSEGFGFQCSKCNDIFTLPERPQGEFACPGCGTMLTIQSPASSKPQISSSLEI